MLQIKNIRKEYRTGGLVQKALDDVSLNFRDNEFVAILGPSGSGKTTLLNIIGGLDRYDSGDLIINGVSTKKYSDRDWDSYRNHTIGFVFQSYNLIPHQTVLSNVELALTIGGISKEERRRRAADALEKVGLGDQMHKKPTQMSGGQMQRVAIARALVNDPDILLADEPTGALDSETSIQVMELIKEIADDRLVIMVTHNPELAEQYANRIVNLKDGTIRSDSNPLVIDGEDDAVHKNLGKASMSLGTALTLSFNNLKTKLARTLLVAFAGSIGIIGIALIMSLSNGVDGYIKGIEEDTLNEYPLMITSSSFDSSALFGLAPGGDAGSEDESGKPDKDKIREQSVMSTMFTMMEENDLKSLKKYIDSDKCNINKYAKSIEYKYNVTPQIYRVDKDGVKKINPDESRSKAGVSYSGAAALMGSAYNTNVFHELPANEKLYKSQYDVKEGRWPEKYNECVMVLTPDGRVSDLCLYALGLKDPKQLDDMLKKFSDGKTVDTKGLKQEAFDYKDVVGRKYKLINSCDMYEYNSSKGVYISKEDDDDYVEDLVRNGEDIEIVGVVRPKDGVKLTMLNEDMYYSHDLMSHLVSVAENSDIVKSQLDHKKTNVLTGEDFGENADSGSTMGDLFTIDEDAFGKAFNFDKNAISKAMAGNDFSKMDASKMVDPTEFAKNMPQISEKDIGGVIQAGTSGFTAEAMADIYNTELQAYLAYAAMSGDKAQDYAHLSDYVAEYMKTDAAKKIIKDQMTEIFKANMESAVTQAELKSVVEDVMGGYGEYAKNNLDMTKPEELVSKESIKAYLESTGAEDTLTQSQKAIVQKAVDNFTVSDEQVDALAKALSEGYAVYAKANGGPDVSQFSNDFSEFVNSEAGQGLLLASVSKYIDSDGMNKALNKVMVQYSKNLANASSAMVNGIMEQMGKQITASMSNLSVAMEKAFTFKPDALADAFSMNMDEDEITELITSLFTSASNTYEGNLSSFGYADMADPMEIDIYPYNFDSKTDIKDILDKYNDRMEKVDEDKVVVYTDYVATLMSSVTDIIDAISYVLIAFISISLIVSSIMIGVITYISVLERKKEIGILRAIGASKRNISQVFNAETFIIGALAGAMGVGISLLLLIPINAVISSVTTANIVAALPLRGGTLLVILSVILTLIGGIIPSRKAAKSDPVTALRVE